VDTPVALSIDDVGGLADTVTKATLAAAVVLAVLVVLIGLAHAIRDRLRQQLIINDTAPLPAVIAGSEGEAGTLSPWLRQRVQGALAAETRAAQGIVNEVFRRDVRLHRLPADVAVADDTGPITSAAKDTMATVANGLRAVAPGQADGILGALGSALPKPRGCQVTTQPLLRGGSAEMRLGLAIELYDLDGTPIASTTLWEPPSFDPRAVQPHPSWQERLVTLIEPAAHWIALRLVARRLRATPARSLTSPFGRRRRTRATRLGLQRLLAAALTLSAMRPHAEHTLAFGMEALDDLDQVGDVLGTYHRPCAIRAAVQEEMGFAYRAEKDEKATSKARESFLRASKSWGDAEKRVAENPGALASTDSDAELAEERERYRIRRLKCALLSGDPAAIAAAAEELSSDPPAASTESRTLYSVACLYLAAVEALGPKYLPLVWEFLGRALLAATEEGVWEHARVDRELSALADRQRFLDDLRPSWNARNRRRLGPLVGAEAKNAVTAALARLAEPGQPVEPVPAPPQEPVSAAGDPPPAQRRSQE
jgi:hypothetical protein